MVLGKLGVEPLDGFEILSLIGVIERFAEKDVLDIATKGRMGGEYQG